MIKLSEQLAQRIVDQMIKVIPYEVIITNDQAIIIGSSYKERIGKFHSVSKSVLEAKEPVEIYDDSLLGVKKGVSSPIFFSGRLVGVIGVAGNPNVVKPFSELVRVTAELLINQEYVLTERKIKEQEIEKFLYELAYANEEYSQSFIERGLSLGIDLTISYTALVINFEEESLGEIRYYLNCFLQNNEYYLLLNPNSIVVFMCSDKPIVKTLEKFLTTRFICNMKIGIGLNESIVANSVKQAFTALNIGMKLESEKNIYLYEDLRFVSMLANFKRDFKLDDIIKKLKSEGKQSELLDTLAAYVYNNGEANKTSEVLHIHRNTLNYRLEKIQEISGKNPKNLIELFELFTAYVISML
ncbi:helix-turn-helix domain-containing protein [Clostridiaceae bacterium UIB06]|uniref:Helix-turn-helix domain-containing protein n=1 Tax=Clostridium thailandense TaxID=2794346 RepID=A0A949U1M1_9CLOT|nr:sugar diacid recognition domain-containing protein [Clostridium thailandense]MBV7274813.1 helix-turn-helix domain-containing protein [Clostridium thailandense]MCH5137274.1 helix-turn-helix domain-containing protein [Clostridiaceae bacterium UIB06]